MKSGVISGALRDALTITVAVGAGIAVYRTWLWLRRIPDAIEDAEEAVEEWYFRQAEARAQTWKDLYAALTDVADVFDGVEYWPGSYFNPNSGGGGGGRGEPRLLFE